jgi:hypothetical protein
MTAYAAAIARQMIAHALADEERRLAQRRDTERGGRRSTDTATLDAAIAAGILDALHAERRGEAEPCDRCSDTGKVYLASFVTPLNLAPWDEGPQVGDCPACASRNVGRDRDAQHTPHDVSAIRRRSAR